MGYLVSNDKSRIDRDKVAEWLSRSHWAANRSRELIDLSIDNSMCWAAFDGDEMVAFCRVVTDQATFAWLCDVWVDEAHRGHGVSKLLVGSVMESPEIRDLRMVLLGTRDAHGLYEKFGFSLVPADRFMVVRNDQSPPGTDCCTG